MAKRTNFRAPSLEHVLREALRAHDLRFRTCVPAEVEAYDEATDTVDVRPAIDGYTKDFEQRIPAALRTGVPLWRPGSGGWTLRFPVRPGAQVLLVCADRDIEDYRNRKAKGCAPEGPGGRLQDAFALPMSYGAEASRTPTDSVTLGLADGSAGVSLSPTALTLTMGAASLTVQTDAVTLRLGAGTNQALIYRLNAESEIEGTRA